MRRVSRSVRYDWLISGAGLTGATLAERLATHGARVLVVDRRPHLAGNAYDEIDAYGHLVHRYGPHIFHTNAERVWAYLSRFTSWRSYEHRVVAEIDDRLVPLPFNLDGIEMLFARDEARRLSRALLDVYGEGARVPMLKLRTSPDRDVRRLADFVYEKVFLGYTRKQWGMTPEELDPSVTGRVPVLVGRDDRYFRDTYQGMPASGYTRLVEAMLDRPKVDVALETDAHDLPAAMHYDRHVYTGPIDAYFDYLEGPLPYRSLDFVWSHHDGALRQPVGTVNHPNAHAYTRSTEMKHLTGQDIGGSAIVREYPHAYEAGRNDPYYPVPTQANRDLYAKYAALAAAQEDVLFAGRLGDYAYYNMDQAVARALTLADRIAS